MFVYLQLGAVLTGMFLIVPGAIWLFTGSRAQAWQAAKGYAVVMAILVWLPMLLGFVVWAISSPFTD
jgi:hypothetical protein